MTTDRALRAALQSWLDEGPTDLPDRVLDAVLDHVPATPQRRSWWPAWRFADMNALAKLLVATAAVVAVAVVGINVLAPTGSGPGSSPPALSPTATPVPTPSPQPVPSNSGSLAAGTYRLSEPYFTTAPFTFTVPDGWTRFDGNFFMPMDGSVPNKVFDGGNGVSMAPWVVSHVYRDSCQWSAADRLRPVGSPAEVVTALTEQTGHDTSPPTLTTLGGYPATRMELSVPATFDATTCQNSFMRLWPDAGPKEQYGLPIEPGMTITAYVVDLDGTAQLIVGIKSDGSSAADVAELEQVIQSIQFE